MFCFQCRTTPAESPISPYPATQTGGLDDDGLAEPQAGLHALAAKDPLAFLKACLDSYRQRVRDYDCIFSKQERIGTKLTNEQEMRVRYRENPPSVNMEWIRNADKAEQALWVAGRWTDAKGMDQIWVKPAGPLLQLVLPRVKQPINGPLAKAAARRTIDQFGFRSTLELIVKYSEIADRAGELDLRYLGEDSFNGRPTYLFERRLPYDEDPSTYPDRLLRFHIDQEWLLPTACYSYADEDGKILLGKYTTLGVQFNVSLTDADFDPMSL